MMERGARNRTLELAFLLWGNIFTHTTQMHTLKTPDNLCDGCCLHRKPEEVQHAHTPFLGCVTICLRLKLWVTLQLILYMRCCTYSSCWVPVPSSPRRGLTCLDLLPRM